MARTYSIEDDFVIEKAAWRVASPNPTPWRRQSVDEEDDDDDDAALKRVSAGLSVLSARSGARRRPRTGRWRRSSGPAAPRRAWRSRPRPPGGTGRAWC